MCTAGFREDSSWIRIYPVPFRKFDEYQRYTKFQWIELDLDRNAEDHRVESFRPRSPITLLHEMKQGRDWRERRNFVLGRGKVFSNLKQIIELNRRRELSLATFRPTKIHDLIVEEVERDWDKAKLDAIVTRGKQQDLFEATVDFKVVNKLPFKFSYRFEDDAGQQSTLMIEDWEIGALFWRQFKKHGSESQAIMDLRNKYLNLSISL